MAKKKEAILKDKNNLPPAPAPEPPPGPKDTQPSPVTAGPVQEIAAEIPVEIKPTGDLKRIVYGGLNFWLNRRKDPLLQDDEKAMLADPLDRFEYEILKALPGWLRDQFQKSGPFGGPALETGLAVMIILDRRKKPKPAKPPAPAAQEPAAPEKPAPGQELTQAPPLSPAPRRLDKDSSHEIFRPYP